ncbi:MAG: caspase family protein, partial [Thermoguttaceae bacterium]|nr:caspase family protein [Thermoguttaceae bacterium]
MRKPSETRKTGKAGKTAKFAAIAAALAFGSWGAWNVENVASARETATGAGRSLAVVAKKPEKCAVLLVGVDAYVADGVLPTLQHASSDVRKLRDALTDEIGFAPESIRTFVSDGLPRERPQREAIMAAFDEILAASGPDSTVVIALSGHGFETENGDAAFCPEDVDAKFDGEKVVVNKESAILIKEIAKELEADDAGFKLLIVDACRNPIATARSASGARSFSRVADPEGVAFLQSCASGQVSYEHPDLNGGVFTHYFTEGLKGAADLDGDGGFTFNDVCDYAKSQTKRFVDDELREKQTPFTTSSFTDFWLKAPTREPGGTGGGTNGGSGWFPFALLALTGGFAIWAFRLQMQIKKLASTSGAAETVGVDVSTQTPVVPNASTNAGAEADYRKGRELAFGLNGTKIDGRRGVELLTKAADAGSVDAQAELARLYWIGCAGTSPDAARAYDLAFEAAQSENPFALDVLGDCYNRGRVVEKDEKQAAAY